MIASPRFGRARVCGLHCAAAALAVLAHCESNGSDRLRYRPAEDAQGAPCLNWRGENRCEPKHGVGPERGRWQRSDLMLPPIRPADLPEPAGPGAQAHLRYCSTCHNLPAPAMHAAADWKPIIERMRDRMAQAARYGQLRNDRIPGDRDASLLEEYLTKNALSAIGIHDLPEPRTRDAQLFQAYCAACHALPRPSALPEKAWVPVVDRMFRYLANSEHGRNVTPDARGAVLRYLNRHAARPK